jgi:hypothetical protein
MAQHDIASLAVDRSAQKIGQHARYAEHQLDPAARDLHRALARASGVVALLNGNDTSASLICGQRRVHPADAPRITTRSVLERIAMCFHSKSKATSDG